MINSLADQEHRVASVRARLESDLRAAQSPVYRESFKAALVSDITETKDRVVRKVQSDASNTVNQVLESVKSRLIENPAAGLAITAGLAWHFLRKPPIATALIGTGLFSLFRTDASHPAPSDTRDAFAAGRERLMEQVASSAHAVRNTVAETTEPMLEAGKDMLTDVSERVSETAQQWKDKGTRALHDLRDSAAVSASEFSGRASSAAESSMTSLKQIDANHRDSVLFGVAGLAVAAAAVFAYQRRVDGENQH